jgi:hypothetical protein
LVIILVKEVFINKKEGNISFLTVKRNLKQLEYSKSQLRKGKAEETDLERRRRVVFGNSREAV